MKNPNEINAPDVFLALGSQYYVYGRYASSVLNSMPVSATLLHHAIEMFLKAYLSKENDLNELKKLGHNLDKLWIAFKKATTRTDLDRFDNTISDINKLEDLRYPDQIIEGFVLSVGFGERSPLDISDNKNRASYHVNISALDSIVEIVFEVCKVNSNQFFNHYPQVLLRHFPNTLVRL